MRFFVLKRSRRVAALMSLLIIAVACTGNAIADANEDLEKAYQKEFAFLEEQQRNLKQRLAAQKQSQAREVGKLTGQIDTLNQQLLDLDNTRQQLNEQISETERALETASGNRDAFDLTHEQAKATLADYNQSFDVQDEPDPIVRVMQTFDAGIAALAQFSSIHTESRTFFSPTGKKMQGDVSLIGQIAAIARSDDSAQQGALVPVGGGDYKLLEAAPGAPAPGLPSADNNAESLSLFLFEGPKKAIDVKAQESLIDYIQSGGIVAWVIIILGALALLLIVLRAMFLSRAGSSGERILKKLRPHLAAGKVNDALDVCKSYSGSTSRVVQATLRNVTRDREHVEDIISESILHESPALNRFSAIIMVIASIAPLLGLLGTVTGMISTFDIITEFGTGDPKLLSGGISTALVTTQLGLVIAIPALILGNLLSGWSNRIKDDMEKMALTVVNTFGQTRGAVAA
jgi:biopolymer transport protein ExbB